MSFPNTINLNYGWEKVETSGQKHKLGTRGTTPDGRVFYYAQNSSAAIVTGGMLVDGLLTVAAHDMDVPAGTNAAGTTAVSVEVPTTDLTKDQYADGYMIFNDGPGQGEVYRIKSHPAHDASDDNTVIVTIDEPDGLATATTSSSLFGLFKNPYNGIAIVNGDGTLTFRTGVIGVSTIPVTASYYCWIQTAGIGSVNMGAQVAVVGDALTVSQETDESGCAERADHSDESDLATIGVAIGIPSIGGTLVAGDKQACILHIRN